MDIGDRIKTRRKELNLTIEDLVEATGKNKATLYRYENGDIENIPLDILRPLAECLNVPVTYFVDDTNDYKQTSLGSRLKEARKAKGLTQEDLGNLLGIQKSAVAKYENGRIVNLKQSTLKKISEFFDIPIDELMSDDIKPSENNGSENKKAVEVFAKNLNYYMLQSGVTQKELSEILGVSKPTFCEYCNAKKYPRMEKVQALANYFNISVSDLVDETSSKQPIKQPSMDKNDTLAVIAKLQSDDEFADIVFKISKLDDEKILALKKLIDVFMK